MEESNNSKTDYNDEAAERVHKMLLELVRKHEKEEADKELDDDNDQLLPTGLLHDHEYLISDELRHKFNQCNSLLNDAKATSKEYGQNMVDTISFIIDYLNTTDE